MKDKENLNLEKVSNGGGKIPEGEVSVNKNSITIPAWCKKDFGGKEEGKADVYTDKENKVIAIEQNENGEYSSRYNRLNCSKILQSLGIEHEEKKRYPAKYEDNQLLIDLS